MASQNYPHILGDIGESLRRSEGNEDEKTFAITISPKETQRRTI